MPVIFPKCERAMAGRVPPEELVRSCLEAVGIVIGTQQRTCMEARARRCRAKDGA